MSIKKIVELCPFFVGRFLALTPFKYRLGSEYVNFENLLLLKNQTDEEAEAYTLSRFREIFNFAKENFSFYEKLYKENDVYNLEIESIADIKKLPVISKEMIRSHVSEFNGHYKLNTGGTSGKPFAFFVDKNAFAREWAHMHYIWNKKGYNYKDFKFTFRGKNLKTKKIVYNPVHNEFVVNTYLDPNLIKIDFLLLLQKHKIKFLHGYPSAIFNFFKNLDSSVTKEEKSIILKHNLICFFGSEYPQPYMVNYLKNNWNMSFVSWYGHSEMCILAPSYDEKLNYVPMHTYGYAEVLDDGSLLGTSFHNYDMPLIRYNTEDNVTPQFKNNGMLSSFTIKKGRNGDFIVDKKGNKVSLTALIFGRHHKIFELAEHIQIAQINQGEAKIFIISKNEISDKDAFKALDLSNVEIDFQIEVIKSPILTKSGKLQLLIKPESN